jgi:hypothetical protein
MTQRASRDHVSWTSSGARMCAASSSLLSTHSARDVLGRALRMPALLDRTIAALEGAQPPLERDVAAVGVRHQDEPLLRRLDDRGCLAVRAALFTAATVGESARLHYRTSTSPKSTGSSSAARPARGTAPGSGLGPGYPRSVRGEQYSVLLQADRRADAQGGRPDSGRGTWDGYPAGRSCQARHVSQML